MLNREWIPTQLIEPEERPPIALIDGAGVTRLRGLWVGAHFLLLLANFCVLKLTGNLDAAVIGRKFGDFCQRMGVLWIKVGQLLSMRSDLFPRALCTELARLQDRAEGFPAAAARSILERELGEAVEDLFASFEDAPRAAASIAQVHRARLRKEKAWVAVKVRRPGVDLIFARDMALIQRLFQLLIRLSIMPYMRWADMLWELRQVFTEELDYRYEISNQLRLRKTLARHQVVAPRIFQAYCTRRVIVMEYIDAVSMADYLSVARRDPRRLAAWRRQNGIDPKVVAKRLLHSYLRQVLEDNLFHADLHPGNIFLLRDNRIALLDFGSAGSNEGDLLRKYDAFLDALSHGRYAKAVDIFLMIMPDLPAANLAPVKEELQRALHAWGERCRVRELPYKEKSASFVFDVMTRIMARRNISISWAFFKVLRGWATMDTSLRELNPEADLLKLKRRYIGDRRRREFVRAMHRMPATLLKAQQLIDYAPEFAELAVYRGAVIRRMARIFEGTTTRAARLLAAVFGLGAAVNLIAALLMIALMLYQHAGRLILSAANPLHRLALQLPPLDVQVWLLLILFVLYAAFLGASLARRFRRRD